MRRLVVLVLIVGAFTSVAISDANPPKDSEFIFARVQFTTSSRWLYYFAEEPWHHDYPFSEDFVLNTMRHLTNLNVTTESYQIVRLDKPEVFRYPFLYFSEPGFMDLTTKEVDNLREWFDRGGFAVFDDFRHKDLDNLMAQMRMVFPNREFRKLDSSHPLFKGFFEIDDINMKAPYEFPGGPMVPDFWGLFDDKDRLIAIANHDNDLGEFFEWVDKGEMEFQPAARATRLMVNYLIYGLTH